MPVEGISQNMIRLLREAEKIETEENDSKKVVEINEVGMLTV